MNFFCQLLPWLLGLGSALLGGLIGWYWYRRSHYHADLSADVSENVDVYQHPAFLEYQGRYNALEQAHQSQQAQFTAQFADKDRELQALRLEHRNVLTEKDAHITHLTSEHGALKSESDNAHIQLAELKTNFDDHKVTHNTLLTQVNSLQSELQEAPKEVIKEVEKIVHVEVIKHVPVEVVKEIHAHALTHAPVESVREIEKIVHVEVPVEVIRNVPVEVVKEINTHALTHAPVETVREVEKIVHVEVEKLVEVPVEVIKEVEKIVMVDRPVEVVKEIHAHALTHAPVESVREIEKIVHVEVPVEVIRNVPVEVVKEIYAHALTHASVESVREVEKLVEVPVEVIRNVPVEVVKEIHAHALTHEAVESVREVERVVTVDNTATANANGKRSYNMSITADEAHASDYGHTYLHSGDYKTFNYHYWKGEDGWYYLYFLNQAGHVVLMSDGYPTEDECRHNLAHILIHADEIDYYTRHTLRNGYYFYYLRDAEDNILAHSPRYKSATAMEQGILAFLGGKPRRDDLKIVEGIGPKIEELLNAEGIYTWRQLSRTNVEVIKRILTEAGPRFKMHNPTTWARQSEYAADGRFAELKVWQDELNGGKE